MSDPRPGKAPPDPRTSDATSADAERVPGVRQSMETAFLDQYPTPVSAESALRRWWADQPWQYHFLVRMLEGTPDDGK